MASGFDCEGMITKWPPLSPSSFPHKELPKGCLNGREWGVVVAGFYNAAIITPTSRVGGDDLLLVGS